ncbi:MAG: GNAT family N-acetyltransferase [Armatimonadetes bacterium]|nr:GNAT family N-acetyltransferase [Armatimonadota bacterium]
MTLLLQSKPKEHISWEYLLFKEVSSREELLEHFALRYHVFTYHGYLEENLDELDIDPYDFWSRFLVCYTCGPDGKKLAGAVRVVMADEPSPLVAEIRDLVESAKDPRLRFMGKRRTTFPSEQAFPEMSEIIEDHARRNKRLAEGSRTARLPELRDSLLSQGLVLGSLGLAMQRGAVGGVGSSSERLAGLYKECGCQVLAGIPRKIYPKINVLSVPLFFEFEKMTGQSIIYTRLFKESLEKQGSFCLCKDQECLNKGGYLSPSPYHLCPRMLNLSRH